MASQARALLANQMASPDVVFDQAHRRHPQPEPARGGSPRRRRRWTSGIWRRSLAFYKARFADASNFTFVFVGSFTLEAIKPLVETYIASLPATHAHETWRDLGITPPTGVVEKTIEKGIAPKSEVAIVFSGPFEYDDAHRLALRAMTMLLQSRLFDTIRQELGGTYSITATPDTQKFPRPGIHACGSTGRAIPRAPRCSCSACSRRSSSSERRRSRRTRWPCPREPPARFRAEQPGQRLFPQSDRAPLRGRRRGERGGGGELPEQIAALTGDAIQQAAQTYLNTALREGHARPRGQSVRGADMPVSIIVNGTRRLRVFTPRPFRQQRETIS